MPVTTNWTLKRRIEGTHNDWVLKEWRTETQLYGDHELHAATYVQNAYSVALGDLERFLELHKIRELSDESTLEFQASMPDETQDESLKQHIRDEMHDL